MRFVRMFKYDQRIDRYLRGAAEFQTCRASHNATECINCHVEPARFRDRAKGIRVDNRVQWQGKNGREKIIDTIETKQNDRHPLQCTNCDEHDDKR